VTAAEPSGLEASDHIVTQRALIDRHPGQCQSPTVHGVPARTLDCFFSLELTCKRHRIVRVPA
jgi:hypothetical protein